MVTVRILLGISTAQTVGENLEWTFMILFPNYNLGQSIMNIYIIGLVCSKVCFEPEGNCCPKSEYNVIYLQIKG